MRYLIAILTLLQFNLLAAEWNLEAESNGYQYKLFADGEKSILFEQTVAGFPKITRVQNHKHLDIIVVNMGQAGTSCLTLIQNAFIYDKEQKKFLGEFPFQRTAEDRCGVEKVIWKYQKDKIEIINKNTGSNYTVDF